MGIDAVSGGGGGGGGGGKTQLARGEVLSTGPQSPRSQAFHLPDTLRLSLETSFASLPYLLVHNHGTTAETYEAADTSISIVLVLCTSVSEKYCLEMYYEAMDERSV